MTAPEKIWVWPNITPTGVAAHGSGCYRAEPHRPLDDRTGPTGTEYTRSDLIRAIEAAAEERGRIAGLREAAGLSPYDSDGALSSIFDHKIFVKIDAILARIPDTQSDEAPK